MSSLLHTPVDVRNLHRPYHTRLFMSRNELLKSISQFFLNRMEVKFIFWSLRSSFVWSVLQYLIKLCYVSQAFSSVPITINKSDDKETQTSDSNLLQFMVGFLTPRPGKCPGIWKFPSLPACLVVCVHWHSR